MTNSLLGLQEDRIPGGAADTGGAGPIETEVLLEGNDIFQAMISIPLY